MNQWRIGWVGWVVAGISMSACMEGELLTAKPDTQSTSVKSCAGALQTPPPECDGGVPVDNGETASVCFVKPILNGAYTYTNGIRPAPDGGVFVHGTVNLMHDGLDDMDAAALAALPPAVFGPGEPNETVIGPGYFAARYAADGHLMWAFELDEATIGVRPTNVDFLPDGTVIVVTQAETFRFDSAGCQLFRQTDATGTRQLLELAVLSDGSYVTTAQYFSEGAASITLAPGTIYAVTFDTQAIYVTARYLSDGTPLWIKPLGLIDPEGDSANERPAYVYLGAAYATPGLNLSVTAYNACGNPAWGYQTEEIGGCLSPHSYWTLLPLLEESLTRTFFFEDGSLFLLASLFEGTLSFETDDGELVTITAPTTPGYMSPTTWSYEVRPAFIGARFSPDGRLVWLTRLNYGIDMQNYFIPMGGGPLPDGGVAYGGIIHGHLTFDRCEATETTVGLDIGDDLVLVKRNREDALVWAKRIADGWQSPNGQFTATSDTGTVFLSGRFDEIATFAMPDGQTIALGAPGEGTAFVAAICE